MRIVVHDATVLIDLIGSDLLPQWLKIGFEAVTTSLIWHEINRKGQKNTLRKFADKGHLKIAPVNAETMTEILHQRTRLSNIISLPDASALHLAETSKAILLTSDNLLRRCAADKGIEVHGIIWVFDTLVDRRTLSALDAADQLEKLLSHASGWLPRDECWQRIRKWRK